MKWKTILIGLLVYQFSVSAQVGIGTTTPNVKSLLDLYSNSGGLLVPRMTAAERLDLALSSTEAGMVVFQTDIPVQLTPKGLYTFDGTNWLAPLLNGSINGQTLRWDGNKWAATTNLFNQGSSIGIGTIAPNAQLQIHSISANTRLQLTSGAANALENDGLMMGITNANHHAYLVQNENKPLWFGTNGDERLRIDSAGNVGINKTNPSSTLDVNGTIKAGSLDITGATTTNSMNISGNTMTNSIDVSGTLKLGVTGSTLTGIFRTSVNIDLPLLNGHAEWLEPIELPNVEEGAAVWVNPSVSLSQLMIGYARVSSPGHVEISFMNMSDTPVDPASVMYNITIIQ